MECSRGATDRVSNEQYDLMMSAVRFSKQVEEIERPLTPTTITTTDFYPSSASLSESAVSKDCTKERPPPAHGSMSRKPASTATKISIKPCIKKCCASTNAYRDEYLTRVKEQFMRTQSICCSGESAQLSVEVATTQLHLSCWSDAPVSHIENILFNCPECIDNPVYGTSPVDIIRMNISQCDCGCCNFNRFRVLAALQRGKEFYEQYQDQRDDLADIASVVCESGHDESDEQYDFKVSSSSCRSRSQHPSLCENVMRERDQIDDLLFYERGKLWVQNISLLSVLEIDMNNVMDEIDSITGQINTKSIEIISFRHDLSLNRNRSGNLANSFFFRIDRSNRRVSISNDDDLHLQIGIRHIQRQGMYTIKGRKAKVL